MRAGLAVVLALTAGPGTAMEVQNNTYFCDRGVAVPVVYATDPGGDAIAVLVVEGQQILLYAEPAASGLRYGWPSGGSHYIWWTSGDEATLIWHDGETGEETQLLSGCLGAP